MKFHLDTAEVFIPDNLLTEKALQRTTHLCIAAHPDDIEIMAAQPILECYQKEDKWFTGVVVTDGHGSPRKGIYANYSDEEMRLIRREEQHKAAKLGEYSAVVMLDYPSNMVKDGKSTAVMEDIITILKVSHPEMVFTHNLADKHDSHVAVTLQVISALRSLPETDHPCRLYGCEGWRDLDWMLDDEKQCFDLSAREDLQFALLNVFDSQISGGKHYDIAAMARRRANATFADMHNVDAWSGVSYAMDMTPLLMDASISPEQLVHDMIVRFSKDVTNRLLRLEKRND
jgi:LmbE family N-acetylglucosaminyl deacetylase